MYQRTQLITGEFAAIAFQTEPETVYPTAIARRVLRLPAFPRFLVVLALVGVVTLAFAAAVKALHNTGTPFLLTELTTPPADCEAPCWHGIRPGQTTLDEAVALLNAMDSVSHVQVTPGMISWWWDETRNPIYAASGRAFDGRIETETVAGIEQVSSIVLNTTKPLGDFAVALGQPDSITLYTVHPQNASQREGIVYVAHYPQYEMDVFNTLVCPMSVDEFWHAPSYVAFGQPNLDFPGDVIETETLPGWFFRDLAPGCGA